MSIRSMWRTPIVALLLTSGIGLSGCASFSPDSGMSVVSDLAGQTIGKEVAFVRSADVPGAPAARCAACSAARSTVDAAVQIALLSNKGLQAAYNELALAETDLVEQSLPPNPTFSISRISGNGASEIERQVVGDILALATLPFRSEIARERFRQAQLRAALETLRLAAEVRRDLFPQRRGQRDGRPAHRRQIDRGIAPRSSPKSSARPARSTSSIRPASRCFMPKPPPTSPARARRRRSARERLTRLMGLWGDDLGFRLPDRLAGAAAPSAIACHRSKPMPSVTASICRSRAWSSTALAKSLDLTAGDALRHAARRRRHRRQRTTDPEAPPFRERGFDIQFQIPIFDGGEVRVRQAAETYNQAFNRLTEKAVNVRSEARDAYRVYRSTYDIASHYQREILPLRQIITEEMQLRFSSMQIDVFALLTEARQRLASLRAAIDAKREFLLAQSELQTAVNGGGFAGAASENPNHAIAAAAPAGGGH